MVNTKRPVSDINPAAPTELAPKQNDALESDKSSPSTIASARPDLNSPVTESHHVPDMNEANDHLVAGTLGGQLWGLH
jgi:hypothetical protein